MATMLRVLLTTGIVLTACNGLSRAQTVPPNVKLNSDFSPFLQNEEQVWINLTDSLNVIADWRDFRLGFRRVGVGRSTDGGATWFDQLVSPLVYEWQSDPCLVGDRTGRFFMNMLDFDPNAASGSSLIVVYTSTNGGQSWLGPVPLAPEGPFFEDKQFTAVDRTGGLYDGYYYCSWTRFPDAGPNRMIFVRSTDGGQTFDDTVAVGPEIQSPCGNFSQGQFSIPIVNSDGSVHVFWQGLDIDSTTCDIRAAIRHSYSTDGGATFTPDTVAFYPNLTYWNVDGGINVYGMPNGDADLSGGAYDGTIYIAQTQLADALTGETDVWVRRSTDNGMSWSEPVTVNDDASGQNIDQFHPWLIVNEEGVVMLVFYDQRNDSEGHWLFDCYFSASFDGGETFTANYRLSSVSSNPGFLSAAAAEDPHLGPPVDPETGLLDPAIEVTPLAGLIAEYIGVHAKNDYVVAVWTDTRDGTQDVYSARFEVPFLPPRLQAPADGWVTAETQPLFAWSTCWHEAEDSYRLEISTDSQFSNLTIVDTITENSWVPDTPLDAGVYFWRVKAFRTAGDSTQYSAVYSLEAGCSPATPPVPVMPPPGDTLDDSTVTIVWSSVAGALAYRLQLFPDTSFIVVDTTLGDTVFIATGLEDSTEYTWQVNTTDACGTGDWSVGSFRVAFCPILNTGDVDVNALLNSGDIIYLVNYVFKSGSEPLPLSAAGDVDCDGDVDSSDIIYLVNYVFKSGPPPCDVCTTL